MGLRLIKTVFAWAIVLLLECAQVASGNELQLVASSPFSLLLQPIHERPSQRTSETIEDSIAMTLLKQHNGSLYMEMQAAVQKIDFFESSNRSQVQFFTLASRRPENQTLSFFRLELNRFIEDVLVESPLGRASLLRELVSSRDEALQGIESFEVVPLNPVTPPRPLIPQQPTGSSPGRSQSLSTLDIVLIVCSGLIFLGILYMIIQHHQDRGYIENQRLRALNYHSSDMESQSVQHSVILPKHSSLSIGQGSIRSDIAPSTPSTIHSTNDGQAHAFGTPERRIHRFTAMTPKALLGASSVDGSSVQSIFEGLESDWSQNTESKKKAASASQDLHYDASSDTSDDPFGVDVEAASSAAATANDDDRSKASSAVQEWMMSIQVVPSPARDPLSSNITKTSEVTQPSMDADSSGPSLAQTSLDVSSIDHRSLEQSLASSEADELGITTAAKVIKIEV